MIVRTAMVVNLGDGREEYVNSKAYNIIEHEGYMRGREEAIAERKYIIKEDGSIHHLDEDIEDAYNRGRAEAIEDYTDWLRKTHANFDEDYAEDIKSDYLEQLKEDKHE